MARALANFDSSSLASEPLYYQQQLAESAATFPITTDHVPTLQNAMLTTRAQYTTSTQNLQTLLADFRTAEENYKTVCLLTE